MISAQTALILFAIAAVLFGARKLPEIGRGVGEAIRNFKKGVSDEEQSVAPGKKEEPAASIENKEHK